MQSKESDLTFSWGVIGMVGAGFFVMTLFVFGASVRYGFLTFDDPYLIVNNLTTHGPTPENVWRAFTTFDPELYIPLTFISYQLNYLVAGLNPGFYHATNIALHALNGLLLSYLAYLLLGRKKIALFLGFLWLIHPINTEAVVWLSGRKDLLSTFFYLATITPYLRFRYGGGRKFFALSIVFFLLALLSKVSVFTLPAALVLLEFLMRGRREWNWGVARDIAPFAVLSVFFAFVALFGKERVLLSSTISERILLGMKSTVFYLEQILFPVHFVPVYPQTTPITIASPEFFVPLFVLCVIGAIVLFGVRRTKWPAVVAAIFIATLLPSFFNVHKGLGTFFAVDRYAYVPSIWLAILLGVGVAEAMDRLRPRWRTVLGAALAAWLLLLSCLSWKQTRIWQDDETLFSRILELYPDSISARASLSMVYRERGRVDLEEKILREGLARERTVAYLTGIGSVLARRNDLSGAMALYEEAKALDPLNPEPLFFMGALEEQRGNREAAERDYREAIRLDESYVAAYTNLGAIYLDKRRLPEAEEVLRKAVAWNQNSVESLYNLFQTLELLGRTEEALPYLEDAYALSPENAELAMAVAYRWHELGRDEEALEALRRLLEREPRNLSAKRLVDFIRKRQ